MRRFTTLILSLLLFAGSVGNGAAADFFPWGLRLGSPWALDRANVEYTGKLSPVPAEMQYGAELEFDGVDDYVDTGASLSDGDDYTLCATVTPVGTQISVLIDHDWGRGLRVDSGYRIKGQVYTTGNVSHEVISASDYYAEGDTIRLVWAVKNSDKATLYCDGVYVGEVSIAGLTTQSGSNFRLGCDANRQSSLFNGIIDNVQIWNHAFTQSDVEYDFANQTTTADTRTGTDLVRANLKGHWKLDEQWGTVAEDSSDGGNPGTLVGFGDRYYPRLLDKGKKPLDNATLYSGQMLDFDGVDDYVQTPLTLTEDFTLTATVMTNDIAERRIVHGYYGFNAISVSSLLLCKIVLETSGATTFVGTTALNVGTVYRLVMVAKSGEYVKGYINGVLDVSETITEEFKNLTSESIQISSTNSTADGFIGNVQIWDAAMTAEDIAYDYANPELPAYNCPGTSLTAANLKGWWPLIAGSGDTAYDWSGNGNHGTLTGFTDVQTAWDNAAGLSDPRVCQTALCEFGMGSNFCSRSYINSGWYTSLDSTKTLELVQFIDGSTSDTAKVIATTTSAGVMISTNFGLLAGDYYFSTWVKPTVEGQNVKLQMYQSGSTTRAEVFVTSGLDWQLLQIETPFTLNADGTIYLYLFPEVVNPDTALYIKHPMLSDREENSTVITHTNAVTNALTPIRTWEDTNQFTREYNELNFNGKSRSETDITAAGTYSVEMVVNIDDVTDLQYIMDGQYNSGTGYIRQTNGTIAVSSGTVYVDNAATTTITAGMAHVVISGITLDVTKVFLGDWYDYTTTPHTLTGQMPMFKVWEGTLDATAVAKKYSKAARKYNLGE